MRLIDAEQIKAKIEENADWDEMFYMDIRSMVDSIPTIKCETCKHCRYSNARLWSEYFCSLVDINVSLSFGCARWEKNEKTDYPRMMGDDD